MKRRRIEDTPAAPPLDGRLRALIEAERAVAVPDDLQARVLRRARTSGSESAAPRVERRRRLWPVARAAVAAAIVFALGAAASAAWHAFQRSKGSEAPIANQAPNATSETEVSAAAPPPGIDVEHEERRTPRRSGARVQSSADDDAAEILILDRARAAIAAGAFRRALAPIAEHAHRFPSGRLAEEREALKLRALNGLGRRDEARRAAAAFRARFPGSSLLPRVEELAPKDR